MKFVDEPNFEVVIIIPIMSLALALFVSIRFGEWLVFTGVAVFWAILFGSAFLVAWRSAKHLPTSDKQERLTDEELKKIRKKEEKESKKAC